ncbi:hypothetical protein [Acaryochloris marina]|uniref:Uncharacterized protein n=1 Tax=Acaryochloris marina (strain MBIC 11017) TaxID=329726 RepID=A8ZMP6_ACAM1|nr:hypothetical protein [Acaryochloris marina]ABW32457.1 hypothetical protein AM1_C0150 [Acaryochloris marina MBIC11017]
MFSAISLARVTIIRCCVVSPDEKASKTASAAGTEGLMIESSADVIGLPLDKVDVDIPNKPRAIEDIELSVVVSSGPSP